MDIGGVIGLETHAALPSWDMSTIDWWFTIHIGWRCGGACGTQLRYVCLNLLSPAWPLAHLPAIAKASSHKSNCLLRRLDQTQQVHVGVANDELLA